MEQDNKKEPEKKKENVQEKGKNWIGKADKFMDESADKIHESKTYGKAGQSLENATLNIFRKAGRLWGKSEHYFKNKGDKTDTK